ncbi:protein-L-isoaspartate(D-aspartate) O-methyltransferase [Leifsonia sp. F6_8S_P_1B]|uniref:Protein-L-isoaspartate O-methyltransferase n=1 Tax=Leifsonia williamsii TaxID=3035919 RepID=A0ABT8KD29_9MICO|nr:protein-L-isoaspartate(D-aspartate) O-methyltransferase [Leifsonia williamsii]MDN4614671.1 protein-L-isoaspartate(D-aspartate) O-methyltransferase [Leifsonia williamsii]
MDVDYEAERGRMVEQQLAARGIEDQRVLDAMRRVPRHEFVPETAARYAYEDHPMPIGDGQTISQPYIVALMLEAARIGPEDSVLDVGTGSGYAAAVAAQLAHRVVSIERHPGLAVTAAATLEALGYRVNVVTGDGTLGWTDGAPYDAIVAAATGPSLPRAWVEQLAPRGRIVMPIGRPGGAQHLAVFQRRADGELRETNLGAVAFVPLVGDEAWPEA